jgi:IPT/TIG domain/S-layer homology domain
MPMSFDRAVRDLFAAEALRRKKIRGAASRILLCLFGLALAFSRAALGGNGNTTVHNLTSAEGLHIASPGINWNNALYFVASDGGQFNNGSVVKVALDGKLTFSVVHSFAGGTDGKTPLWITVGDDGDAYILLKEAQIGPTGTAPGVIVQLAPNDTLSAQYYLNTNGSDGKLDKNSYVTSDGNGGLLVTAPQGGPGSNPAGAVSRFAGGVYTVLKFFNVGDSGGSSPVNAFPFNGSIVTMTSADGANGVGAFDTMNNDGSGINKVADFTTQPGGGITSPNLVNFGGSVFSTTLDKAVKYGPDYRAWTLADASGGTFSGVSKANDGNLYGSATGSAASLFQFNPLTGSTTTFFQFPAGTQAYSAPIQAADGNFYGGIYADPSGLSLIYQNVMPPGVNGVNPASGPATGFSTTQISGTNFSSNATGLIGGVPAPFFQVSSPTSAVAVLPAGAPGTLADVTVLNGDPVPGTLQKGYLYDFLDIPGNDAFHDFVEKIFRAGITAGVGGGNYGRNNPVLRQQMAVFLEKAIHGSDYVPPPCAGVFPDVPCSSPFATWIEQLHADGITGGCGGGNFCPTDPVIRQQMAVFLEKAKHGSGYVPPACTGIFGDVPCSNPFAAWIEALYNEAITGGCQTSPPLFCPGNETTRGQMAVFIVKAFGL